jgi:hypothetical protein
MIKTKIDSQPCISMLCSICQKNLGALIINTEFQYQVVNELLILAGAQPICPKCTDTTIRSNLR